MRNDRNNVARGSEVMQKIDFDKYEPARFHQQYAPIRRLSPAAYYQQ